MKKFNEVMKKLGHAIGEVIARETDIGAYCNKCQHKGKGWSKRPCASCHLIIIGSNFKEK